MQATSGEVVVWENLAGNPRLQSKPSDSSGITWTGAPGDWVAENVSQSDVGINAILATIPSSRVEADMTALFTIQNLHDEPLLFRIRAHDGSYHDEDLSPPTEVQPNETVDLVETFEGFDGANSATFRLFGILE